MKRRCLITSCVTVPQLWMRNEDLQRQECESQDFVRDERGSRAYSAAISTGRDDVKRFNMVQISHEKLCTKRSWTAGCTGTFFGPGNTWSINKVSIGIFSEYSIKEGTYRQHRDVEKNKFYKIYACIRRIPKAGCKETSITILDTQFVGTYLL